MGFDVMRIYLFTNYYYYYLYRNMTQIVKYGNLQLPQV